MSGVEIAGMAFRVLVFLVIAVLAGRLYYFRKQYIWLLTTVNSLYHAVVYLEFILDWGWSNRVLVSLGYPFLLVVQFGLVLQCLRRPASR